MKSWIVFVSLFISSVAAAETTPLEGKWTSVCMPGETGTGSQLSKTSFENSGKATNTDYYFDSNDCSGVSKGFHTFNSTATIVGNPMSHAFLVNVTVNPADVREGDVFWFIASVKFTTHNEMVMKFTEAAVKSNGQPAQLPAEVVAQIPAVAYKRD